MKSKEYIDNYSSGNPIKFREVLGEFREFIDEVRKWNRAAMHEEFEDILLYFQLWLYWQFGMNGELWNSSRHSVAKTMARKPVWQKIYVAAGLPENISNFCGNCMKIEKVVKQLGKFGVEKEKAEDAFRKAMSK